VSRAAFRPHRTVDLIDAAARVAAELPVAIRSIKPDK